MLILLALVPVLFVSLSAVSRCRCGVRFDTFVLGAAFSLGQVFLVTLACGVLGILKPATLLAGHWLLALLLPLLLHRKQLRGDWRGIFRLWGGTFQECVSGIRSFFRSDLSRVLLVVFLVLLGIVSFYNILLPVHDWDGFMYHLFLPANWLQQGSFDIFPAAPQLRLDKWVHFPGNIELFNTWHLALAGSDALVEFAQWPLVLCGLLGLAGCVRLLGGANRFAALVLPLALAIPIALAQLNSSYVDFSAAALLFLMLYTGMRALGGGGWGMAVASGIAGAILVGSKASGFLFAGPAFLALLLALPAVNRLPWRRVLLVFVLSGGVTAAAGSYFFIRNWKATGNPVYPYQLSLGAKVLFPGIDPVKQTGSPDQKDKFAFLKASFLDTHRQFVYTYYGHPYAGHGLLPLAAGLPAFAFLLLFFLLHWHWRRLLLLLALVLPVALQLLLLPTLFVRFTLAADLLLVLAMALASARMRFLRPLFLVFLGAGVVYGMVAAIPMNFLTARHLKYALASPRTLSAADSPYSGTAYRQLDRLLERSRRTVAYSGLIDPYPLFGRNLTRRVVHVPATNYAAWLKGLEAENVFVLVLGKPGFRYPEQAWATAGRFRMVLSNPQLDVWLFDPAKNGKLWEAKVRHADYR